MVAEETDSGFGSGRRTLLAVEFACRDMALPCLAALVMNLEVLRERKQSFMCVWAAGPGPGPGLGVCAWVAHVWASDRQSWTG